MQAKLPVLACTDPNTDIGKIIVDGGFGCWCGSNDVINFAKLIEKCVYMDLVGMGEAGYETLLRNFNVENTYKKISN